MSDQSSGSVRPIRPEEVVAVIPDVVIEAFNELIAENFVGNSATVLQAVVVERIVSKGLPREGIFAKGWLNVEGIYREAGWVVKYDKPEFNEDYETSFTFIRK